MSPAKSQAKWKGTVPRMENHSKFFSSDCWSVNKHCNEGFLAGLFHKLDDNIIIVGRNAEAGKESKHVGRCPSDRV